MDKIATPSELQAELHRILVYAQTKDPQPSRDRIAASLRELADRVALQKTPFLPQIKISLKALQKQAMTAKAQVESYMKSFKNEFSYWDEELKDLIQEELQGTGLSLMKIDTILGALAKTLPNASAIEAAGVEGKKLMVELSKAESIAQELRPRGPYSTGNPAAMISLTKDMLRDALESLGEVVQYLPDFRSLSRSFDQAVMGTELLVKTPKDKAKLDKLKKMSASLQRFNPRDDSAVNFLEELEEACTEALKLVR